MRQVAVPLWLCMYYISDVVSHGQGLVVFCR